MSVAPPPDPNVPIYNPLYWETSSAGGIDTAYLNANYLRFPLAQGQESFVGISNSGIFNQTGSQLNAVNITATGGVQGATIASTGLGSFSGNLQTFGNINMFGAGTSLRFPDGSTQSTAASLAPLNPSPAGTFGAPTAVTVNSFGQVTAISSVSETVTAGTYNAPVVTVNDYGQITAISNVAESVTAGTYTNSNVTVNDYGQITAIANGTVATATNQLLSKQTIFPSTSVNTTVSVPAGTKYVSILFVASGGSAGSSSGFAMGGGGGALVRRLAQFAARI